MRRTLALVVPAALAAALLGCAAAYDVRCDYDPAADFSRLRTYAHVPSPPPEKERVRVSPLVDQRVRDALDRELPARGLTLDASGTPDLLAGYFLVVEERVDWTWVNTYWGWGWWGPPRAVPYSYEEGTLVVDLVDAATQKLVWRGSTTAALTPASDPARSQARIDGAVHRVLANWPPPKQR